MMGKILRIAAREIKKIWTDSRLRSVVLLAPFAYAILLAGVYRKHVLTDLPIGVFRQDDSLAVRTLLRMMEGSQKLKIVRQTSSMQELQDLMFDRSIDAAVVIPSDFTTRLKRGHDTRVVVYVNASSMVSANTAAKALNEVIATFSAGVQIRTLMKKGDRLSSAMEKFSPVKLDLRSLFNPSYNYTNFLVPGLLIAILQQVILLGVALTWTGEREAKTLPELFAISRNPWHLMIGKTLPYFIFNGIVAEIFLRIFFPMYSIPMEGNWHIAIPFTFLFVFTIVTWGMWVSGVCKTQLFATQALMFVAMPSFILSGFTWPQEGMPDTIRFLAHLLPMTYFVGSFRSIYLAGAPLKFVYQDFLWLLVFAALNVFLSYKVIQRLLKAEEVT